MIRFDKIALAFLKIFLGILAITVISSLMCIVPYYSALDDVANDVLMRASLNNYIRQAEVDNIIKDKFSIAGGPTYYKTITENTFLNQITNTKEKGIAVYARVNEEFKEDAFNVYSITDISPTRKVIIKESPSFNPKNNNKHLMKLRQTGAGNYNSAQRGDTIHIRVESKMNFSVYFLGYQKTVGLPLSVTKSAPAVTYYRI